MNKFYITTAILYTNAPPHIGFALELLQADVLARYNRLVGNETWFLTGTDEHGTTVVKGAEKHGKPVEEFVDEMAGLARKLTKILNISNNDFIRTTDKERHWPAVIKFWNELVEAGGLYKKKYKGSYCVGHESFIKKSELIDGRCPLHKTIPEEVEEENWFFRLTKHKKELKQKIESGEFKIVPESRIKEVLNLIDDAEDISFSRPVSSLKWGIPVPNDPEQTMYVWADALTNYISAMGYKDNTEQFQKFWPADVHLIGKDILRFHVIYWPAMLLSAGLPLPKAIYVHGFITVGGEKMSKTVGNIIDPFALVEKYGVDPVRYFLLREISSAEDGDFSYKKLEERYNGDLANGLGNLVSRVATLIENNMDGELIYDSAKRKAQSVKLEGYEKAIEEFRLHDALGEIWKTVADANKYVDERKPWLEAKESPERFLETIIVLVSAIHDVAWLLQPFLPETSEKIFNIFDAPQSETIPEGHSFHVKKGKALFPKFS
ncbi:MAG: methionine--tRNA ligase [Candidatus Yanofskybacteria bacterium RIFCSPHIGHO2_01_FULL_42_12]|uniref:methionine--tRNA ligase n=1 Tax=Candidatus Yanofskybacteria bacterium RIFCSPLOWO2_01_FULL_42_49 TaxID=1802694 RepID=A0A1F8GEG0_9BACT|nr:MAG: methionine--tRNA ligase [Candidatus Yanofskybacteria bacterium RIFCSPHIGHO2_01_FULL_42_12]OGN23106.1 MAG: methionine--tRNA ligase [Candidatus Yanofskybacteria bacterium RIFCSPLOWO2_01_FULL_42_49]